MSQQISLQETDEHLVRYIEAVEQGEEIIFIRHGQPVAKLIACHTLKQLNAEQLAARERTRQRMKQGYSLGGERINRDELYDR
jgi:antitoxin (DNA-binding transcriptional repressor) of toxin-antitoxin stability system